MLFLDLYMQITRLAHFFASKTSNNLYSFAQIFNMFCYVNVGNYVNELKDVYIS